MVHNRWAGNKDANEAAHESQDSGPFVDLHTHSTASDGALTPSGVVRTAADIKLAAIALTDHDTVDGLEEATVTGRELGVRIIPGCELSAYEKTLEVHLLVLHIQSVETIQPYLDEFRQQRHDRAVKMVELLNRSGINLSLESVIKEADGGVIGRPHVARALLDNNFVKDLREAFDKFIGYGRPAYVAKPRLEARDAIEIGHKAGGLVFWAHPGKDGARERTRRLVADGLDGLEVVHPSHTVDDIKRLGRFVEEFSLLRTGGSDWHGATEGPRVLGNMNIPASWLEDQEKRVKRQFNRLEA